MWHSIKTRIIDRIDWQGLRQDFRERFLNFKTALGLFDVCAGFPLLYIAFLHQQYIYQSFAVYLVWRSTSIGLRLVFHNPVKEAEKMQQLLEARKAKRHGNA